MKADCVTLETSKQAATIIFVSRIHFVRGGCLEEFLVGTDILSTTMYFDPFPSASELCLISW